MILELPLDIINSILKKCKIKIILKLRLLCKYLYVKTLITFQKYRLKINLSTCPMCLSATSADDIETIIFFMENYHLFALEEVLGGALLDGSINVIDYLWSKIDHPSNNLKIFLENHSCVSSLSDKISMSNQILKINGYEEIQIRNEMIFENKSSVALYAPKSLVYNCLVKLTKLIDCKYNHIIWKKIEKSEKLSKFFMRNFFNDENEPYPEIDNFYWFTAREDLKNINEPFEYFEKLDYSDIIPEYLFIPIYHYLAERFPIMKTKEFGRRFLDKFIINGYIYYLKQFLKIMPIYPNLNQFSAILDMECQTIPVIIKWLVKAQMPNLLEMLIKLNAPYLLIYWSSLYGCRPNDFLIERANYPLLYPDYLTILNIDYKGDFFEFCRYRYMWRNSEDLIIKALFLDFEWEEPRKMIKR